MTEFQEQVISDLAELKTHMRSLIGNGQPGRITLLENQVQRNAQIVNRLVGGLILASAVLGIAKMVL